MNVGVSTADARGVVAHHARARSTSSRADKKRPVAGAGRASTRPRGRGVARAGENVDASSDATPERLVVAITGATGFVGSKLVERLLETGAEVRILTRDPARARAKLSPQNLPKGDVAFVAPDIWRRGLSGATHVVNLAGEPISTRWDPKVKAEIRWVK